MAVGVGDGVAEGGGVCVGDAVMVAFRMAVVGVALGGMVSEATAVAVGAVGVADASPAATTRGVPAMVGSPGVEAVAVAEALGHRCGESRLSREWRFRAVGRLEHRGHHRQQQHGQQDGHRQGKAPATSPLPSALGTALLGVQRLSSIRSRSSTSAMVAAATSPRQSTSRRVEMERTSSHLAKHRAFTPPSGGSRGT